MELTFQINSGRAQCVCNLTRAKLISLSASGRNWAQRLSGAPREMRPRVMLMSACVPGNAHKCGFAYSHICLRPLGPDVIGDEVASGLQLCNAIWSRARGHRLIMP